MEEDDSMLPLMAAYGDENDPGSWKPEVILVMNNNSTLESCADQVIIENFDNMNKERVKRNYRAITLYSLFSVLLFVAVVVSLFNAFLIKR